MNIKREIIEFNMRVIDRNNNIVVVYIGCLTIPYSPASITF